MPKKKKRPTKRIKRTINCQGINLADGIGKISISYPVDSLLDKPMHGLGDLGKP